MNYPSELTGLPLELREALGALLIADHAFTKAYQACEAAVEKRDEALRNAGVNPIELVAAAVDYDAEKTEADYELAVARVKLINASQRVAAVFRSIAIPF